MQWLTYETMTSFRFLKQFLFNCPQKVNIRLTVSTKYDTQYFNIFLKKRQLYMYEIAYLQDHNFI